MFIWQTASPCILERFLAIFVRCFGAFRPLSSLIVEFTELAVLRRVRILRTWRG